MDEQLHEVSGTAHQEYLDLFKDVSFSEKWRRVANGLKQPKDSGEYKFARLQVIRLSAPASAVVVPIIALLVIGILAAVAPPPMPSVQARIMEPDKPPPVEEPPKKEPPPVLPDERDVEVNDIVTDIPMPGPPKDFSPQPADMDTVAIIKSPGSPCAASTAAEAPAHAATCSAGTAPSGPMPSSCARCAG